MNDLVERTIQYVESILGVFLSVKDYTQKDHLSLLLQNHYKIFEANLLDEIVLLIIPREKKNQSPSILKKHFFQIEKKTGLYSIYLCNETNSYARKELIKNKISFIVPDNQLYLPRLGVCLREYYKSNLVTGNLSLSTVAQLVLLYHFHNRERTELSPSFLAAKLGYSTMSFSRVFKELEVLNLGTLKKQGRKRIIVFNYKGEELWKASLPFMVSPVKRIISIPSDYEVSKELALSGHSALSKRTMINPPPHPVYAMSLTLFNARMKNEVWEILPDGSSDKIDLQLWRYNPVLFSTENKIDKLSLYLSLKDNGDERIESALEELLEDFKW